MADLDPNSPDYAKWYNGLPLSTRTFASAPGSASANYTYGQEQTSTNAFPANQPAGPPTGAPAGNPLARPAAPAPLTPNTTSGMNPLGRQLSLSSIGSMTGGNNTVAPPPPPTLGGNPLGTNPMQKGTTPPASQDFYSLRGGFGTNTQNTGSLGNPLGANGSGQVNGGGLGNSGNTNQISRPLTGMGLPTLGAAAKTVGTAGGTNPLSAGAPGSNLLSGNVLGQLNQPPPQGNSPLSGNPMSKVGTTAPVGSNTQNTGAFQGFNPTYDDYKGANPQNNGGSEGGSGTYSGFSEDQWNAMSPEQKWAQMGQGVAIAPTDPRYKDLAAQLGVTDGRVLRLGNQAGSIPINSTNYVNPGAVGQANGVFGTSQGNLTPHAQFAGGGLSDKQWALLAASLVGGGALAGGAFGAEGLAGGAAGGMGDESAGLAMGNPFGGAANPFGPGAFEGADNPLAGTPMGGANPYGPPEGGLPPDGTTSPPGTETGTPGPDATSPPDTGYKPGEGPPGGTETTPPGSGITNPLAGLPPGSSTAASLLAKAIAGGSNGGINRPGGTTTTGGNPDGSTGTPDGSNNGLPDWLSNLLGIVPGAAAAASNNDMIHQYQDMVNNISNKGDINSGGRPGEMDQLTKSFSDPDSLLQSQGYKDMRQHAMDNLSRTEAARGMSLSGNEMGDLTKLQSNMDYNQISNTRKDLMNAANLGDPSGMAKAQLLTLPLLFQMKNNNNSSIGNLLGQLLGNKGTPGGGLGNIIGNALGRNGGSNGGLNVPGGGNNGYASGQGPDGGQEVDENGNPINTTTPPPTVGPDGDPNYDGENEDPSYWENYFFGG